MTTKEEYLSFTVKFMKLIRIWPQSEHEMSSGMFTLKQVMLIIFPTALLMASVLSDFYRQVGLGMMDQITDATENILVSGCMVTIIHFIVCATVQRQDILKLFTMLNDFNKFGIPPDQVQTENLTALITKSLYLYGLFACVMYFFLPFFFLEECEQKHKMSKFSQNLPCGMFSHMWLPFRFDYSPVFELAELLLIYPCVCFVYIALSFTSLQFGFIMHISCHMNNFKRLLHEAIMSENAHDAMKMCVRYHTEIIRFCDHLSVCFSKMSFIHISLTSISLSIIAFEFIQMDSVYQSFRLFLHFMGWLIVLFVVCLSGQQLIDESSSICHAAYDTNWLNADVAIQKYILLIILRAQKPLVITTGPFGILSLEQFLSITSTAYTYFTLLASTQ